MPIRRFRNHSLANRYTAAYTAAILLHLLLLVFVGSAEQLLPEPVPERREPDPLSFEFVTTEAEPSEPPPDTRFRSDRNARSADRADRDLPTSDAAYNEGIVNFQEDFRTRQGETDRSVGSASAASSPQEAGTESETERIYKGLESMAMLKRRGVATQAQRERRVFGTPAQSRQSVAGENTQTRALDHGGLQLSTYDWNFSPYLKYLKDRIQSHIFPPAAFSRLGMIEGESKVRFRIYPDGRMERLEVLDSRGSELLLNTSTQAVELSAPFKPLPDDFPEPFLEITGIFAYVLLRGGR